MRRLQPLARRCPIAGSTPSSLRCNNDAQRPAHLLAMRAAQRLSASRPIRCGSRSKRRQGKHGHIVTALHAATFGVRPKGLPCIVQVNMLVVGSGGREHALSWRLSQSERCKHLFVAPGNPGTAAERNTTNVALDTSKNSQARGGRMVAAAAVLQSLHLHHQHWPVYRSMCCCSMHAKMPLTSTRPCKTHHA